MGFTAVTNLCALKNNLQKIASETGKKVMLMVKCDAYGRGLKKTAEFAEEYVHSFGVATADEGAELREVGIKKPVLVTMFSARDADLAVQNGLDAGIYSLSQFADVERSAKRMGRLCGVHFAVNTGMNRVGVSDKSEFLRLLYAVKNSDYVKAKGVYTHFYSADAESIKLQNSRFKWYKTCAETVFGEISVHSQNSASLKVEAYGDTVRTGLAAYGDAYGYRPTLEVYGNVIALNEVASGEGVGYGQTEKLPHRTRIAVVSGGYGDGLNFLQRQVLINGKRVNVVGDPCMDVFMADVGGVDVEIGDKVVICGRSGNEIQNVSDVATQVGSSPYRIATAFKGRIYRKYLI